jgi:predicted GIY-YIG superfamily endonuclease
MKWIYILKCDDNYYYIGETKRLFRRFNEHFKGKGGINTTEHNPICILAIYKVSSISNYIDYDKYINEFIQNKFDESYDNTYINNFEEDNDYASIEMENNITECIMINNKDNWKNIIGGKYVKEDCKYIFPINSYMKDFPLCFCKLPCDIKKNQTNEYLYFRCPKKNFWDKLIDNFNIEDEPCNFYKEYTKDKELRLNEKKKVQERKLILKELFKNSYWLKNIEIYNDSDYPKQCIGGCCSTANKLSYLKIKRNLCYDCFIDKNKELTKKYSINSVYSF